MSKIFLKKNFRGNKKAQSMKSKISPTSFVSPKQAQMQISFGMIFAIILIVVFLAFAIYGIWKFLDISRAAQVEKFKSDLQTDIDSMWQSTHGSQLLEYSLPGKISQVCFIDDEFENLYFVPNDFRGGVLEYVDFSKTIPSNSDELCIDTVEGKISLIVKKIYGETLVTITE